MVILFGDLPKEIFKQSLDAGIVQIERFPVDVCPLGKFLDGNVRGIHFTDHLLDGCLDGILCFLYPKIGSVGFCHGKSSCYCPDFKKCGISATIEKCGNGKMTMWTLY